MKFIQGSRANTVLLFIALALVVFGVRIALIDFYAVPLPYWDDWGLGKFLYDYAVNGFEFSRLNVLANEHRMWFARLLAIMLFDSNHQQWDPLVGMVANAVLWTVGGLFLLWLARLHQNQINARVFSVVILAAWIFPVALVNVLWGIQSHNYFMILFAILGSWFISNRPFKFGWCFGVLCMVAACLTLAGGAFLAVSIFFVYALLAWLDAERRREYISTTVAALLVSVLGMALILSQPGSSSLGNQLDLIVSATTFLKSLSFPLTTRVWPSLIFVAPVICVLYLLITRKLIPNRFVSFALSLFGFVVLVSLAIAVARPAGGLGPTLRYGEFLALAWIASLGLLLVIQQPEFRLPRLLNQALILAWVVCLFLAIPRQAEVAQHVLQERNSTRPHQEDNVRGFINTGDQAWLDNKPMLHIPFPRSDYLAEFITEFAAIDMLPYHLQRPALIRHSSTTAGYDIAQSPFIKNGIYRATKDEFGGTYRGEDMFSSYKPSRGGVAATGGFVSETFEIDRPYAMIPVTGYFGYPDISLRLVNEYSGESIDIADFLGEVDSRFAEGWREVLVRTPRGVYRLVGEDENRHLWFGFATPRTVGRLSYWTQSLLPLGGWLWKLGLLLLMFACRSQIVMLFSVNHHNAASASSS